MARKIKRKKVQGKKIPVLENSRARLILLLAAVIVCYFHTLDVPFYFDDYTSIRNNPVIRSIDLGALWHFSAARVVGYLTFAFDYAVHGYATAGYHLVNIAVHMAAVMAVYFLTGQLLRTPRIGTSSSVSVQRWLPLMTALLFAVHPLQTQAVTYIVQRIASLAALFYLSALYFYVRARLCGESRRAVLLFSVAGACALLAFLTKQNTFTLPLAVVLVELCFFGLDKRFHLSLAAVAAVVTVAAGVYLAVSGDVDTLSGLTRETTTVSRLQYLVLQLHILWLYIGKFLFPVHLQLNYDYAVPGRLFSLSTVLYGSGHLLLLGGAIALIRRLPLPAFGVLFYYLAQLVESSLIPIRDFGFEHRTYLPNFGLCLAAGWLVTSLLPKYFRREYLAGGTLAIALALGVLTWQRNNLWRDQVAFFQHEVAVNPGSFRSLSMLGEAYYVDGRIRRAVDTYIKAQPLFDSRVDRDTNLEEAYYTNFAATLQEAGYFDQANTLIDELMARDHSAGVEAKLRVTRGNIHALNKRYAEAEAEFNRARELDPGNVDAVASLAKLKLETGDPRESYRLFRLLDEMDPGNRDAGIGIDYFEKLYGR